MRLVSLVSNVSMIVMELSRENGAFIKLSIFGKQMETYNIPMYQQSGPQQQKELIQS
jgi:hypothetical protein